MKLGCSYNCFDSEELLEYSINSIRKEVYHIVVVYQTISNFGHTNPNLLNVLNTLKERGLIDELIEYIPIKSSGHINEISKRNIGLSRCKAAGCTHHLSLDCDECYITEKLVNAKLLIKGFDSSACQMKTYYKLPTMVLSVPEEYYVPFIYEIDDRTYQLSHPWPVLADPTRKMKPNKIKLFKREEIEMHHFSYVRRDLMSKLINSSASANFSNRINKIYDHWKNWSPGQKALFAGKEERLYELKKVENIFNIPNIF